MTRAHRIALGTVTVAALAVACVAAPATALAHGASSSEPSPSDVVTRWSVEVLPSAGMAVAAIGYLWLARRVNRVHTRNPVPRWRMAAFMAGIVVLAIALLSAVDIYADELLADHMIQHLLLTMVAPPLLAMGAPVTLLLRAASPGLRRDVLLPPLHSRVVRLISAPLVAWALFGAVLWVTHFSPLYDAALESQAVHDVEHLIYLGAGLLFWWPVVAADPLPSRMSYGARMAYLVMQMPVGAAVGLAIYFAPVILYDHYATNGRAWGPNPMLDQQVGGLLMWGGGDTILLVAIAAVIAAWMRADIRRASRADSALRPYST